MPFFNNAANAYVIAGFVSQITEDATPEMIYANDQTFQVLTAHTDPNDGTTSLTPEVGFDANDALVFAIDPDDINAVKNINQIKSQVQAANNAYNVSLIEATVSITLL